jgi:hypothetical protein
MRGVALVDDDEFGRNLITPEDRLDGIEQES